MQVSEQLRKALRQLHFRRWQNRLRNELGSLLDVTPEVIRFVDWELHDQMIEQLHRKQESEAQIPEEVEWDITERDRLQQALILLAGNTRDYPAYLHIPKYVTDFIPYKGWQTCEVPLIPFESMRMVLTKALKMLDKIDFFGLIFNEMHDYISFDGSISAEPNLGCKESYMVTGWGPVAADWIRRLRTMTER